MKSVVAAVLLVLALCSEACAQNEETVADLRTGCESKNEVKRAYAVGFISGVAFMANYVSKGALENDVSWPKTKGAVVDAVCRYIELHPEIWAQEATVGVLKVVDDLYLPSRQEGKKK